MQLCPLNEPQISRLVTFSVPRQIPRHGIGAELVAQRDSIVVFAEDEPRGWQQELPHLFV